MTFNKLMELFEKDIEGFVKYHNQLGLDFIKKDRENIIIKDWSEKKPYCNPDFMLLFGINLRQNLKKHNLLFKDKK